MATNNLDVQNLFQVYSPDDVAVDPSNGNLFIVQNYRISEQPQIVNWRVTQFTPSGQEISSFTSNELGNATGISFLPNGNLILVSTRSTRIAEFTKTGQLVAGGIDFTSNQIFTAGQRSIFSIAYKAETDTVLALDSRTRRIFEFNRQGQIISTTDFTASFTEAKGRFAGITRDPLTGNYWLSDDETDSPTGDNRIYEITPSGQVLASIDVVAATGFVDPEGVAIDPNTRTLYAIFDNDDERGNEFYLADRNRTVAFKIELETFAGDTGTNDTRTGDAGNNSFLGGGGSDVLLGEQGADILYGGSENDIINGNQGNDQLFGGSGNDLARGGQNEDYLSGSSGDDSLFGDRGNDTISGGEGNDIINGNLGNDSVSGDAGNDLVRGGRGDDILTGGQGNDTLHGDEGFDNLNGGDGNDSLLGESGEDILNGGAGADTLIGGGSRDTFVLAAGQGGDVIADFIAGTDSIGLTAGLTYDQLTFTQGLVNNVATAEIRFSATGEILASLQGVSPTLLRREMFVQI